MSRFADFIAENLLFGYELVKKEDPEKVQQKHPSFVTPENDDGAVVVAAAGGYGTYIDLDGSVRSEAELISKYREMALNSEVHKAVDEIVNQMVEVEEEEIVKIKLDEVNATDPVKDALEESFSEIMTLLNFNSQGYNIIRRWYIDGRLYYHTVIDITQPKNGIAELRYVDPRKIRKIREIIKRPITQGTATSGAVDASVVEIKNEYYMYNDKGFSSTVSPNQPMSAATTGIKIAEDSIAHITSGLTDVNGSMCLSFLHFAIKGLNQLRAVEDASVIYRLARAPERRVWYIDVGTLPKAKAEQYVTSIMTKHKNRLSYDASTGEYRDDRKFMTMLEDYWLPRREGGKGTQVETLPAGENLGEMTDVEYFQKKLYQSLNVPISRLNADDGFSLGRATEITQDEVSFGKFVARLRNQFGQLFTKLLERHVTLKQIMSVEEFRRLAPKIKYDFAHDNHFLDLMEDEVMMGRADLAQTMSQWVGRYISNDWINKRIWRFTEEEVEQERALIEEEQLDPIYSQPMPGQMDPMMAGMDGMGPEETGDMAGDQEGGDENYESSADSQFAPGQGGGAQPPKKPPLPSEQKAQRLKTKQRKDPKRKNRPK